MQIWNGIETGVQFDQIQSKLFPHHLPNSRPAGNWIPDHCPRMLSPWDSPLSRCPVDSQIWQPRPPPTLLSPLPSSWWRLLGDSSMRVVPRGAGSGQIYTLNSVEQSFHQSRSPFLHVFPSIGGCHLGKTSAIRGWYLQGFWHQPNESGQFPSIIRSCFHSFDLGRWIHLNNEHGVAWHQCIAMEEIIMGTALMGRWVGVRAGKQNWYLSQAFKP